MQIHIGIFLYQRSGPFSDFHEGDTYDAIFTDVAFALGFHIEWQFRVDDKIRSVATT